MFFIQFFLLQRIFWLWFPTIAFMVDPGDPAGPGNSKSWSGWGFVGRFILIVLLVVIGLVILITLLVVGACLFIVLNPASH